MGSTDNFLPGKVNAAFVVAGCRSAAADPEAKVLEVDATLDWEPVLVNVGMEDASSTGVEDGATDAGTGTEDAEVGTDDAETGTDAGGTGTDAGEAGTEAGRTGTAAGGTGVAVWIGTGIAGDGA